MKEKNYFIWTVLIGLLVLRLVFSQITKNSIPYRSQELLTFQARIFEPPTYVGNHWLWVLKNNRVYLTVKPGYVTGDVIQISGQASCRQASSQEAICDPVIYDPEIRMVRRDLLSYWFSSAYLVRSSFEKSYRQFLTISELNLLTGVVLGSKGLDSQFKKELVNTGLSHVVAASGMNVTLVSGGVWIFLSTLRLRRIYLVVLSIGIILFYCTITSS